MEDPPQIWRESTPSRRNGQPKKMGMVGAKPIAGPASELIEEVSCLNQRRASAGPTILGIHYAAARPSRQRTLCKCEQGPWRGTRKKLLDTFPYGNVLLMRGTGNDNLGCVQRRGGAAAAGDFELSCAAGAAGGGDCGLAAAGATLGFEAPARLARSGPRRRAPRRPPHAVSNQRRGDPAASRMDGNVRTLLASSVKPRQGTCRAEKPFTKQCGDGF